MTELIKALAVMVAFALLIVWRVQRDRREKRP